MLVNGCECSIVIKTTNNEFDVPYSEETLREAYSLLVEEASIEGDGISRAIRKMGGVTGCIVAPLTISTTPLLLYLAFGSTRLPVFVSETRSIYQHRLELLPMEDTDCFDLLQDRRISNERLLFEGCRVKGFELRIHREESIKIKFETTSECPPITYPYQDIFPRETGERFSGDCVKYRINGKEYANIYGLTLSVKKEGGTKTEIWIKWALEKESDIPEIIDEMTITAQLLRDKYESRHYGVFRITLKKLLLTIDETDVNSTGAVIGPLRYYVSGVVSAEVFSSTGGQKREIL